jgi:hypothetical protein
MSFIAERLACPDLVGYVPYDNASLRVRKSKQRKVHPTNFHRMSGMYQRNLYTRYQVDPNFFLGKSLFRLYLLSLGRK